METVKYNNSTSFEEYNINKKSVQSSDPMHYLSGFHFSAK